MGHALACPASQARYGGRYGHDEAHDHPADRQLAEIRKRVAARDSPSVSGFIQGAVQRSLENAAEFREIVAEALKKTGGPLKGKERAWARKTGRNSKLTTDLFAELSSPENWRRAVSFPYP